MVSRISLVLCFLLLLTLTFVRATPQRALKKGSGKKGSGEVCCPCKCYAPHPCECDCIDCDDDEGKGGKKGSKKGSKKGGDDDDGDDDDDNYGGDDDDDYGGDDDDDDGSGKKGDDDDDGSGKKGDDDDDEGDDDDDEAGDDDGGHHDKPNHAGDDDDDNEKPGDDDDGETHHDIGPTNGEQDVVNDNSNPLGPGNHSNQGETGSDNQSGSENDDQNSQGAPPANPVSEYIGLLDPSTQSLFEVVAPNILDPSYLYDIKNGTLTIVAAIGSYDAGLKGSNGETLMTPIIGYGTSESDITYPGRTVVAKANEPLRVKYENRITKGKFILTGKDNSAAGHGDYSGESVVDTTLHWAYNIPGYMSYSIEKDGVPISPHLHGGHTDYRFDGNPEFFFSPNAEIIGPRWEGNFPEYFEYDNSQTSGLLFYHDHALGITRLNVYAGMAGLYVIRDERDTGLHENPLNLPAYPYELGLAISDKMYKEDGSQFYPAFPGDPYYDGFINGEGANFPYGKPSVLAEFFGDFMTVNGKIWPKMEVEPRLYRLRLLNNCDSRFIILHLVTVPLGETNPINGTKKEFSVIGGDHAAATGPAVEVEDFLIVEPSSRYDILVDFSSLAGQRLIMANAGGDEAFGGTVPGLQAFEHTDKIMAFDVVKDLDQEIEELSAIKSGPMNELNAASVDNTRRVGLFEGMDEYGRLQPLLGPIDKVIDAMGNEVEGTLTWAAPATEFVKLDTVEEWEVWNLSGDAHPFHMHLIDFIVVSRHEIDLNATVLVEQPLIMHNGAVGSGWRVENPTKGSLVDVGANQGYADFSFPKDVVTALPGQVTTIRAKFDRLGDYPWHCHILSHEDHEMMRFFVVVE